MKWDRKIAALAEDQRKKTAYHEAGHVVMACVFGRIPILATIVPVPGESEGRTEFEDDAPECTKRYFDQSEERQEYVYKRVLGELAGIVGHDLGYPGRECDQSDRNDMVFTQQLIEEQVRWSDPQDYLRCMIRVSNEILGERKAIVDRVAQALLENETLTGDQLKELCPIDPVLCDRAKHYREC